MFDGSNNSWNVQVIFQRKLKTGNPINSTLPITRKNSVKSVLVSLLGILIIALIPATASAQEAGDEDSFDLDGPELSGSSENASNPLAAVNNTDLRWQYSDLTTNEARLNDYFIDGAVMLNPKLKLKYELHYWDTNISGSSQSDWESALVKLIYFPRQGVFSGGTKYRVAVGIDYIHDLGDLTKGIGFGADQVGPFAGLALSLESGLTVIPLLQHFTSISGVDINITAVRLIALQSFRTAWWWKIDAKIPYDWENKTVPAEAEFQLGKNISDGVALYADGRFGLGSDRLYDWGLGLGLRFNY